MKKLLLLFFLLNITVNGQIVENIQKQFDSIISEADILYKHEKAAWHATDILIKKKELMTNYGGYVVYFKENKSYITFLNRTNQKALARFNFKESNLIEPDSISYKNTDLTKTEKRLFKIKSLISKQLSNPNYNIRIPNNCNANTILIEDKKEYRFYVIMGPKVNNIIPFGNDYLFVSDSNGKILNWKKFHKTFIPLETKSKDGKKISSTIHSHLKMTPLITATDICNFKLFSTKQNMNSFIVSSTSLNKLLKYDLKSNSIQIIKN